MGFRYTLPARPDGEELLKRTIEAGLKPKAVKVTQLRRVYIDTTVREKCIRFTTDANCTLVQGSIRKKYVRRSVRHDASCVVKAAIKIA